MASVGTQVESGGDRQLSVWPQMTLPVPSVRLPKVKQFDLDTGTWFLFVPGVNRAGADITPSRTLDDEFYLRGLKPPVVVDGVATVEYSTAEMADLFVEFGALTTFRSEWEMQPEAAFGSPRLEPWEEAANRQVADAHLAMRIDYNHIRTVETIDGFDPQVGPFHENVLRNRLIDLTLLGHRWSDAHQADGRPHIDTTDDGWAAWLGNLQLGLQPMFPRVSFTSGSVALQDVITTDLYSACCVQLFNHQVEQATYHQCSNDNCGRLFVRQQGRSKPMSDQRRTVGVKYCSHRCAKNQSERDRRKTTLEGT